MPMITLTTEQHDRLKQLVDRYISDATDDLMRRIEDMKSLRAAFESPKPVHNPHNLTTEQVGYADGWRLLNVNEIKDRGATTYIQVWRMNRWSNDFVEGSSLTLTYRTKLTPEELEAATKQ